MLPIQVSTEVVYAPEHSPPGRHLFVYFISIHNPSAQTVQLLSRHWIIQEANGQSTEVVGEGVVGEQPILQPGQSFRYNSFTHIAQAPGLMHGWYTFALLDGQEPPSTFKVEIPAFALRLPQARNLN